MRSAALGAKRLGINLVSVFALLGLSTGHAGGCIAIDTHVGPFVPTNPSLNERILTLDFTTQPSTSRLIEVLGPAKSDTFTSEDRLVWEESSLEIAVRIKCIGGNAFEENEYIGRSVRLIATINEGRVLECLVETSLVFDSKPWPSPAYGSSPFDFRGSCFEYVEAQGKEGKNAQ
jgi:hypothetical protein